jgi:molecular chaperone DnaK
VFEVKSTNGDTFLGGEDFDMRLVDYLADEFKKEQGIDLRKRQARPAAPQGSRREGQDRAVLATQTEINLPFITADAVRARST